MLNRTYRSAGSLAGTDLYNRAQLGRRWLAGDDHAKGRQKVGVIHHKGIMKKTEVRAVL